MRCSDMEQHVVKPHPWAQTPALEFVCCVTLGKWFDLPESQFHHPKMGCYKGSRNYYEQSAWSKPDLSPQETLAVTLIVVGIIISDPGAPVLKLSLITSSLTHLR